MVLDSELEFSYFATLFLWRSCAVPRVGIELTTMLGLDPELGSTHFSMGSVGLLANGVAVSAILTHCFRQFCLIFKKNTYFIAHRAQSH